MMRMSYCVLGEFSIYYTRPFDFAQGKLFAGTSFRLTIPAYAGTGLLLCG